MEIGVALRVSEVVQQQLGGGFCTGLERRLESRKKVWFTFGRD